MLTRTVSRRRWRAARGEWEKRAEADEKRSEANGHPVRPTGAGKRRATVVVGAWEGTGGEPREAAMGKGSSVLGFHLFPLLSGSATHRHC